MIADPVQGCAGLVVCRMEEILHAGHIARG